MTLLVAGHETTANQINMSLITLLEAYPYELARLCANESLIPDAIEELMRFVQLGGGGGFPMGRVATEEIQLGSVTISPGEICLPFLIAANRDRSEFPEPDRLDLSREPRTHMSFGAGVHHCLGAQLARMELQEAFRGLLGRLPGLRLAVPVEQLKFKDKMLVYSLHDLPVTWDLGQAVTGARTEIRGCTELANEPLPFRPDHNRLTRPTWRRHAAAGLPDRM